MKNFKLIIEYDGSAYHGWQIQKDLPSVQGTIEKAIAMLTRSPVKLIGSGRTDAGVHALAQVASFRCDTAISAEAFQRALNALVPNDIVIHCCEEVHPAFHARHDAVGKRYEYRILNRSLPSALQRRYVWHIRGPLDRDRMHAAVGYLLGTHDFSAFEGAGSPRSSSVRRILHAALEHRPPDSLAFVIEGSGFLRYMVRNIVGTLVKVGHGRIPPEALEGILLSRDRSLAGATAPPNGLFLVRVTYN